jgi:hypothetical protein
MFAVQMALTGETAPIIDIPASYHNGAGGFSFVLGRKNLALRPGVGRLGG